MQGLRTPAPAGAWYAPPRAHPADALTGAHGGRGEKKDVRRERSGGLSNPFCFILLFVRLE